MRTQFSRAVLLTFFFLLVILSCEKNSTESSANVPEVTTAEVSAITDTSAQCGGTVTSDGGAIVTARGVCWSTNQNPTVPDDTTNDGTGVGSFTSYITGLTAGTTYYVRAYATNSAGTGYGSNVSFTTEGTVPEVITYDVSEITVTTAQCGGAITTDGGAIVTARGVCWSTNQNPTVPDDTTNDGTGVGSFTSYITGLTAGTTYYVRAYATNSAGTGYGSNVSFTTEEDGQTGTVTDIDGNVYQTIKIGDQWWMAENLKVTHYRNGDVIRNLTDNFEWKQATYGAYCNYNNTESNADTYGKLYNWKAQNYPDHPIAPDGWHVPTNTEWQELVDYLGGDEVAGGKMKEIGTTNWNSPNTGATNESGFSALPGGHRVVSKYTPFAMFRDIGDYAYFWSSTGSILYGGLSRYLYYDNSVVQGVNLSAQEACSIRCIKD